MRLAEDAAKQIRAINGVRTKIFEADEFSKKPYKPRPLRFFICLGDNKENCYTRQVESLVLKVHPAQQGVFISTSENHAVIFGEASPFIEESPDSMPVNLVSNVLCQIKNLFTRRREWSKKANTQRALEEFLQDHLREWANIISER
jgi:hypothetical protein